MEKELNLQAMLAKWGYKPQQPQANYTEQAVQIIAAALVKEQNPTEAVANAAGAIIQSAPDKAAAGAYMLRLVRNIEALQTIGQARITKAAAREITDFWTDTEILDNYDASQEPVRNALQDILAFWQSDKEAGFYEIQEPQRAAAQAGNYGAYIERLLTAKPQQMNRSAAAEAMRANLHEMQTSARNYLSQWCRDTNGTAVFYQEESEIYRSLLAGANDKAVAKRIYNLYKEMKTAIYNNQGKRIKRPIWKEYLQEFSQAYGVQLYLYKPNQLK